MLLRWSCRLANNCFRTSTIQCFRWNHYKALGLSPSATQNEVKAAYYKLSKIYHPDRNNNSEISAKKFRDIVAAYEVLRKAESRRKYDREIIKKFEARTADLSRKKLNKKNKKSSIPKSKSHAFKNEFAGKFKHKSHSPNTYERRIKQEEIESFIVKAIPLVVACLLCNRKR